MTSSAPSAATNGSDPGPDTPVTCAPNAAATCTAKLPTPPDAPITRTRSPALTPPTSRTAWSAATAEIGRVAACAKERFAGLRATNSTDATTYSANDPRAAVDLVARPQPGDTLADVRDGAGEAAARVRDGRSADAEADGTAEDTGEERPSRHYVPGPAIDARRADTHEHLAVARSRTRDFVQPQHRFRRVAVPVLHDRLHRARPLARVLRRVHTHHPSVSCRTIPAACRTRESLVGEVLMYEADAHRTFSGS